MSSGSSWKQALYWTNDELTEIPNLLVNEVGELYLRPYKVRNRSGYRVVGGRFLTTRARNSRVPYLEFSVSTKKYHLHRLLCSTFKQKPKGANEVRHLDDDIYNNALDNLEWGTRQDNASDAVANNKLIARKGTRTVELVTDSGEVLYTLTGSTQIRDAGFDVGNLNNALRLGKKYKGLTVRVKN